MANKTFLLGSLCLGLLLLKALHYSDRTYFLQTYVTMKRCGNVAFDTVKYDL